MRAVVYCRVSTEDQARDGYSLDAQQERAKAYCAAKGWEYVRAYVDGGRSGKSLDGRDAMAALLADARAHLFEQVIVLNFKRLARKVLDTLNICDQLEACGVYVTSLTEAVDTSTAMGRAIRTVLATFAELDRENIVENIKIGMEEAARQGHVIGPLSLGYARSESGDIITTESTILVLQCFERYAAGTTSLSDLAAWANGQGLRSTRGNLLDKLSMRKLLTNVHYRGDVAYHRRQGGGVVARDAIPAIVSRDLFDQVQAQLIRRQRSDAARPWGRLPYPLTGVAVCAYCGAGLIGSSSARGSYLRCSTAARQGKASCRQPMVQAALIESQVGAYIEGFTLPDDAVEYLAQEAQASFEDAGDAGPEIVETERLLAAHKRLFLMGDEDELSYRRNTAPLRKRLAELQGAGQILDVERAMYDLRNIGRLWWKSERQEQRQFVMETFDRIVVEGAQVKELTPKRAYAPFFMLDRAARFGGVCSWLPGQDLSHRNYSPVTNPRTRAPFWVPALAVAA